MQLGPIFKNQIYQVETLRNKGFHQEFAKALGSRSLSLRRGFNSISGAKPQLWSKTGIPDPRLNTSVIDQECNLLNAQFPPLSMAGAPSKWQKAMHLHSTFYTQATPKLRDPGRYPTPLAGLYPFSDTWPRITTLANLQGCCEALMRQQITTQKPSTLLASMGLNRVICNDSSRSQAHAGHVVGGP